MAAVSVSKGEVLRPRTRCLCLQVEQFVARAGKPLEVPARALDAAVHAPHLEAAAADISQVVSALSSAIPRICTSHIACHELFVRLGAALCTRCTSRLLQKPSRFGTQQCVPICRGLLDTKT